MAKSFLKSAFDEVDAMGDSTSTAPTNAPETPSLRGAFEFIEKRGQKPKEPTPDRGIIADTASQIGRGAADAAELTGYAMKTAGLEDSGQWVVDKAKKALNSDRLRPDGAEERGEDSYVKQGVMSGFRSAVPSLTAGLGGAAAGAGIGSIVPGVGTVAGGFIGGALGALGLFGAGIYGKEKQRALDAGLTDDEAHAHGWEQGLIEGGIEAIATPIELMVMAGTGGAGKALTQPIKQTIKGLLKTPAKQMLKNYAANAGIEAGTEMLQSGLGNEFAAKHGLQEGTTQDAVLDSIIPALTMSLLFGVGAHAYHANQKRVLKNTLESGEIDQASRETAANTIYHEINKQDPELAKTWRTAAQEAIKNNAPIDIDQDYAEFASQRQATEAAQPLAAKAEQIRQESIAATTEVAYHERIDPRKLAREALSPTGAAIPPPLPVVEP